MRKEKTTAKARVKAFTAAGKHLLKEIHGLTEGEEIIGTLVERNKFCFTWNNSDAVLYVGENCEITAKAYFVYIAADEDNEDSAKRSARHYWEDGVAKYHAGIGNKFYYVRVSWNKRVNGMPRFYYAKTKKAAIAKLLAAEEK